MHAQYIWLILILTVLYIIELTQLTQPRCDCPQCSVLEKLNPSMKSDLACGVAESRILNPWRLTRKERLLHLPTLIFASICSYARGTCLEQS